MPLNAGKYAKMDVDQLPMTTINGSLTVVDPAIREEIGMFAMNAATGDILRSPLADIAGEIVLVSPGAFTPLT